MMYYYNGRGVYIFDFGMCGRFQFFGSTFIHFRRFLSNVHLVIVDLIVKFKILNTKFVVFFS